MNKKICKRKQNSTYESFLELLSEAVAEKKAIELVKDLR